MRQMASKYSNEDATKTIRVVDDSPLAAGLVGQAYEDSFAKEDREIKRGTNTNNTRSPKKVVVVVKKSSHLTRTSINVV